MNKIIKFEVSLFRFDKDSDYLPYYTKHFVEIEKGKNLLDLLNLLDKNQSFSYENNENFDLVLNNIFVKAKLNIEEINISFGKELLIEPISIKRAKKDLIINDNDFNEKLNILNEYLDEEDKKCYLKLKHYYYASITLNYFEEYIGDSLILLALKIIAKKPHLESKIKKLIKNKNFSLNYHTSLENRIFNLDKNIEKKINKLQDELLEIKNIKTKDFDFKDFIKDFDIKHDFKNFNIAYYSKTKEQKYLDFIKQLKANFIEFKTLNYDLAKKTFFCNKKLTLHIAKDILLDAFDNNADFLLVDNKEDFEIFDNYQKEIQKIAKREINLTILHINELQMLASGNHNEVKEIFNKHKIKVTII